MHFLAVFLGGSACNTKRMTIRGIQQGTGMWNLALWWTIASQRDFRRKLNQFLDPMLTVSNIGRFAHLYHLTLISNPWSLYAILKLANSKNFRKVHSVLSNVMYCYKRSIFCISFCAKSGFQNLHRVFPIESTNTLLSSVGCSFHSVTCVVLNIKHHSWNDFTTHNVFFSSGAPLLVLALFCKLSNYTFNQCSSNRFPEEHCCLLRRNYKGTDPSSIWD